MARLARVVAPGPPHHVTQRGNRRQTVFFSDEDYEAYRALAAIRKHERTGRPLGSEAFLAGLEARLGRQLKRCPPGPKPRKTAADEES